MILFTLSAAAPVNPEQSSGILVDNEQDAKRVSESFCNSLVSVQDVAAVFGWSTRHLGVGRVVEVEEVDLAVERRPLDGLTVLHAAPQFSDA
jgi:hypothetical protein